VTGKLKDEVGNTALYKSVMQNLQKFEMAGKQPQLDNPAAQSMQNGSVSIGAMAPEIAQPDLKGKVRKLSDLKGKVVLVDFWASWCGPCRRENPFVVDMYEKYHKKGFEVFSVSLDNAADRWEQAIQQDKLVWENHVSDLKGWQNKAAADYGVRSIPFPVLIDREGKIVGFGPDMRGDNLEKQVSKLMGS
jgi:thiol-disulfide isomerase/thioredoxin